MIKTFKHKGLKDFFITGTCGKIISTHKSGLKMILEILNAAGDIKDMNFPGAYLHKLKGEMSDCWSVKVNANWRVVFRFEEDAVYDVDYVDYH